MTVTLVLETWFKDTAHSLSKNTLCVKYEPDWVKGEKTCSRQVILDGPTDAQTDHNRLPLEWGLNKIHLNLYRLSMSASEITITQ